MGLGSGAGLEIEAGSGLDRFEGEGSGEEGVDDLAGEGEGEEEEEDEGEVEGGEVEEGTGEDEGEGEGIYYDGSFYNENDDDEEAMRLAGIRLGTYYQQGEGEEGMVRLVGVEGVEGVESMEGLPLGGVEEEGVGVVEEEVLTNLDDGDNDNDFMIMKTTPLPEPIEILSTTIKKTLSEPSKTPRTTPRFSPPPHSPPPVPAIGPLFVRDGDAEWLVLTTDTVLADPLLRKYLPSQRRPYSFRLPLPLPFHTPR